MKRTVRLHFALLVLLLIFNHVPAQWNVDPSQNTPVVVATDRQIDLRMSSDDKGGTYIAWKDYRAGIPDIYIQRLSRAGVPLWTANGVALCTNFADQSTPAIVTDMAGGAIVAWSDWRSSIERDLYAQRVDSNGIVQWTLDGAVVSNKQEREHNERIISDGAGGAIVFWEQQRLSTYDWDIWAQRLNAAGQMVWTPGGIPICQSAGNRINPRVQADGKGGAIVTWQDLTNGFEYDIKAQRVDASGNLKWGSTGIVVCGAAGGQTNPKIDPDTSGGAYIAWSDQRSGVDINLYAQRVDSNGNARWATNGVAVSAAPGNQTAVDLLAIGREESLILTWRDSRSGNFDIYAQKLASDGQPQWTAAGVPLTMAPYDQVNPNIVTDRHGGAIVVWQDSSDGTWSVRAQRVDSAGNVVWLPNGVDVGIAADNQTSPKNVTDGAGGCIFAFQDKRSGNFDIYAHHLYADGLSFVAVDGPVSIDAGLAYPNPFGSSLRIRIPDDFDGDCELLVTDLAGRLIWHQSLEISQATDRTLRLGAENGLAQAGAYMIRVHCPQRTWTTKVIKQD